MRTPFNILPWLIGTYMTRFIEASQQHTFRINDINNAEMSGKFLHISDIHLDPYYLPNRNPKSYCRLYASKLKKNKSGQFGTVGSKCDSPLALVDSAFSFLKENFQDVDFVIYTGDSLRHDRDPNFPFLKEDVILGHEAIVKYVTETFNLSKTKFIPTLGNNDEWTHNQLEGGTNTLFGNLTKIWAPLNLNLTSDFANGGYYRQDVNAKLSVLSLNSLYFYENNEKIRDCHHTQSPGSIQLKWIEDQLKNMREEGRVVYISQHVPLLDSDGEPSFLPKCQNKFIQLLGKFSDVVYGHFTGHTNLDALTFLTESDNFRDKYNLHYLDRDEGPSKKSVNNIVLVMYNAPSIVPGKYSTSLGTFGELTDYIQYYLDIEKANVIGRAIWEIEYIATETYNMKQLSPSEWSKVLRKMKYKNSKAWKKYIKFFTLSS
ncbi:16567_t:CDS:2 [Funneliformis caledonium]|uniref:16567_t:CDS:1 n=1 Tax=Funneliformis caledonium TaxID=1117310 RepID=A0A9N8VIP9_9GLOM|nr:16567_t:CDS:2 [Funneliformis caledonium]